MKFMRSILAISAVLAATSVTMASTITFNGSDIVAPASLTPHVLGSGPPAVGDGYIGFSTSAFRTYNNGVNTPNPAGFNTWLSSLTGDKGIAGFNLWLMDGVSDQAAMWGETLALADTKSPAITPFASAGWTASVYTLGTEWGAAWTGRQLIHYDAISSADYLRQGTTATFGFTADIVGFGGGTGPTYQMWVGAGNAAESDVGIDQLAGVPDGVYFQRAITATAVPLPAAVGVGFSMLGGFGMLAGLRKKLRKARIA